MRLPFPIIPTLLATLALTASAELPPPSFDLDALSPAAGWQTTEKITVTGTFTDDRGFRSVEYRIRGNNTWKEAHFTTSGTVASGTITATFSINLKLRRDQYTRVVIRATDVDGVESDYITRRYRWDKHGFVVRDEAGTTGTNTGTGTNTDTGNGTGTGNGGTTTDTRTDTGTGDGGGTNTDVAAGEFSVTPNQVQVLELFGIATPPTVVLAWNIPGATSAEMDNGIGSVPVSGTRTIASPTATTTYTLTTVEEGEAVTYQAVVTVSAS